MTTLQANHSFRIVGALVGKDLLDALKNRTIITIAVAMLMTMLTSQALPLLLALRGQQTVFLYDAGDSGLADALGEDEKVQVRAAPSFDILRAVIGESITPELGIAIPANFSDASGPVTVDAYLAYWILPAKRNHLVTTYEQRLSAFAGVPVTLETHAVYPGPNDMGRHFMAAMVFVLVVAIVGLFLTPYLMLDEKEAHTLDALLVSPASPAQIVVGKAIAGLVYCLFAAAIVVLINVGLVTNWGVLLLAVLLGSALFVALGLLLGTLFNSMTNMGTIAGGLVVVLLVPMLLTSLPGREWPPVVDSILRWIPSSALTRLIRLSLSGGALEAGTWLDLGVLLVMALVVVSAVVWRVRRFDR